MLHFDAIGFLVPHLNIKSSVTELQLEFVDSIPTQQRRLLFHKYIQYSVQLKAACSGAELLQWVDGSYVTKASYPKDIDLVTFIDYAIIEADEHSFEAFKFPESTLNFGIDAYIVKVYPDHHLKKFFFAGDRLYWLDKFDKTRRDSAGVKHTKGFLEIVY